MYGSTLSVEVELLAHAREPRRQHELQFGAEKADGSCPGFRHVRQVHEQPGVHVQLDLNAVAGHRRHVAELLVLLLPPRAQSRLLSIGVLDVGLRPHPNVPRRAVDDDGVAGLD